MRVVCICLRMRWKGERENRENEGVQCQRKSKQSSNHKRFWNSILCGAAAAERELSFGSNWIFWEDVHVALGKVKLSVH